MRIFNKKISNSVYAISTLSSAIIGVGLFSLPFITSRVGIWVMLSYFLILGFLVILIHYLFGEVVLKTPDFLRLPGYAKIYLGNWGKGAALISTVFGFFGAILAYLIVGGEFLTGLLSPIFGGNNLFYTFLYFLAGAGLIFFGTKAISKVGFWGLILFFIILAIIFVRGFHFLKIQNLFMGSYNTTDLFLPYGSVLFSLWGASTIPEIEEMLKENKSLLRKIIPVSILIPAIIYIFFIIMVLGITGAGTSSEAISGLKNFLGDGIVSLGLFFGVLTTFTSFIVLGLTLKKTLWYDFKIPKNLAWGISCFIPLFLFLIGMKNFIQIIGFVGGVMLGIDGILILLMYRKLTKKKFVYPLILIFLVGIAYEIIYFLK